MFVFFTGLFFHIVGEGVVHLSDKGRLVHTDKENYIDFRMRLLGEGGTKSGKMKLNEAHLDSTFG